MTPERGRNDQSSWRVLGIVSGHVHADGGQRLAGHLAGPARRRRRFQRLSDVLCHVRLFCRLSGGVAACARNDPAGWPCAGLCRAWVDDFGGADSLSCPARSLGLDPWARRDRVLFFRRLRDGGKLAE